MTTQAEVSLALFNCGTHLVDRHLAMVHSALPHAKRSTGWRPRDPLWIVIGDRPARQLAVLALVKIPRATIGLMRTKINFSEPLTVE